MNSITFINEAQKLIKDIKDQSVLSSISNDHGTNDRAEQQIQRRVNMLFSTLMNPTLPSAFALRDIAIEYGYVVDHRVKQALSRFG